MDILIHRMLDLSRFDSPALKLNCEVFDFKPFIEKILENYYVHTEHEIIFIYNSKAKIKADPAMLKTVLENLYLLYYGAFRHFQTEKPLILLWSDNHIC